MKPLFAVLAIYAGCLAIVGLVSPGQSMPEPPEFTPPGNFGDAIIYPFVATWQVIMYVVKLMFSITVIGAPHIIGVMIGTIIIGWVAWDVASMIRGR